MARGRYESSWAVHLLKHRTACPSANFLSSQLASAEARVAELAADAAEARRELQAEAAGHAAAQNRTAQAEAAAQQEAERCTAAEQCAAAAEGACADAVQAAAAARQQLEGRLEQAAAARQQLEGRLEQATAARQQLEGRLIQATAARQQLEGRLEQAAAARQQLEGRLEQAEAVRQQLEGRLTQGRDARQRMQEYNEELEKRVKRTEADRDAMHVRRVLWWCWVGEQASRSTASMRADMVRAGCCLGQALAGSYARCDLHWGAGLLAMLLLSRCSSTYLCLLCHLPACMQGLLQQRNADMARLQDENSRLLSQVGLRKSWPDAYTAGIFAR